MIVFPDPTLLLKENLDAWIDDHPDSDLGDWSVLRGKVTDTPKAREVYVGFGNGSERTVAESGLLVVTLVGPSGNPSPTTNAARLLAALLNAGVLLGGGLASTRGVIASSQPMLGTLPRFLLTVPYVTTGTAL